MHVLSASGTLTSHGLLARDVQAYALCEEITSALIYFVLVFSPWAFGTTQTWAIWVLNCCGYGLGVGLCLKWYLRLVKKYRPMEQIQTMDAQSNFGAPSYGSRLEAGAVKTSRRADANAQRAGDGPRSQLGRTTLFSGAVLVRTLGVLTVSILLYCLTAALNARAGVNPASGQLEYKECIGWLPHSFDSASTWQVFARLVALACFFWAGRDWVVHGPAATVGGGRLTDTVLKGRIASVLWVLSISGALLGLEGLVQRLVGSPKLLFLLTPEIHQEAATQFASFAYRANAAQYFNLLWPVTLGFAWLLHREQTSSRWRSVNVLLCSAGVMAACPIVSGARGAALVDLGMLLLIVATLLVHSLLAPTRSRSRKQSVLLLLFFCAGTLLLGGGLGGKQVTMRLSHAAIDLQERQEFYQRARRMAKDYALFGTGPGSFERVFQLYRTSPESYWPAQLHNDWLETRVTFGWTGSGLIVAALLVVLAHCFIRCPIHCGSYLVFSFWLGLTGCLVQARWDFPLQVYSIVLLFICWCSLLFSMNPVSEAA